MDETTPTPTPPAGLLRPLGFGELFDRAVTLYVRNFVAFSGIVLALLVPWGIVQYFMDAGQSNQLAVLIGEMKAGRPDPVSSQLPPGYIGVLFLSILIFLILAPFALNAVAIGVARIYTGRPVGFRDCYASSLSKFWAVVGLILMQIVIFLTIYGAFAMVIAVFMVIGFSVVSSQPVVGVVMIVLGCVVGLAMLAAFAAVGMALNVAMYGVAIERRGVFDALGAGFVRIFSRAELGRALLFALCAGVIYIAAAAAASGVAILAMMAHQLWLVVIFSTATNAVLYAFTVVLFAVYYYDVRIRREGLDVEADLQSLAAPTTA